MSAINDIESFDILVELIASLEKTLRAGNDENQPVQWLDPARLALALEARNQAQLQELTLLAYQRIGELTREIPKAQAGRHSKTTSYKNADPRPALFRL